MTHTEWEPRKKTSFGELTQDEFELKCDKQFSRVKQILECFYDEDKLQFEGESFKEYAKWVVGLLSADNIKDKALRVKVVYNDKGYTTLPKYAKYTFIEPMVLPEGFYDKETNPENKSLIRELSIDRFTKPVIADKETKVDELSVGNDPADDLPF